MLHEELLMRLDALDPDVRAREMAQWRALYAIEAEEQRKAMAQRGRR